MELDDLKATWAKEQKELEARLEVNEGLVRKLSLEKSQSSFVKLVRTSILGRNLAFVYGTISLFAAFSVINQYEYSIPAFLGGLAMFFSFFQHISLKKPNISELGSVELQKAIVEFQIHTAKYSKYDFAIVWIWLVTLIPIFVFKVYNIFIYSSNIYFISFALFVIILALFSAYFGQKLYAKIDNELDKNRIHLTELGRFGKSKNNFIRK